MKRIDNILARYFGGIASQKDMDALENWLSSDSENQTYFDELTVLYRKVGCPDHQIPDPNTAQAKAAFMDYMDKDEHKSAKIKIGGTVRPFYKNWLYQAASIIILLSISVSVWYINYSEKDILLTSGDKTIETVLPDGTHILLSKNSKLTYQANFGKKDKNLHLSGEATIHSGHGGKGRLHIQTDRLTIEDIGTIFTISAYPESKEIFVSVKEGEVNLYAEKTRIVRLKANETCRYNKNDETIQTSSLVNIQVEEPTYQPQHSPLRNNDQGADASTKKYFYQFDSKPLHSVVEIISRDYGVNIGLESADIGRREITVSFDREKLEIVLDVISETLNLTVKKVADGYRLSEK